MNAIIIADFWIGQDEYGRYSLNDLHRASGGEARHKPGNWLQLQHTQALADEIKIAGKSAIQSKQGLGTFVVKELVYAYAMWISPAFHVKVIRAYDALVSAPPNAFNVPTTLSGALRFAAEQAEEIERQAAQLDAQKPQVEFAQAVRNTEDSISVGDMARLLGMGQNRFFRRLRDDHIFMPNNRPYQHYLDRDYFRVIENVWRDSAGEPHPTFKTVVTGRGQIYLQRKYGAEAA